MRDDPEPGLGVPVDLVACSAGELRRLRSRTQAAEDGHSLLRRVVQGRLDIVHAEQERRRLGAASGLPEVLADLPSTLAGPNVGPPPSRPPRGAAPGAAAHLLDRVDEICGIDELHRLPDLDDLSLSSLAERLDALERRTSRHRQALHRSLDALSAELVHRYVSGEATVDDLLSSDDGTGSL